MKKNASETYMDLWINNGRELCEKENVVKLIMEVTW